MSTVERETPAEAEFGTVGYYADLIRGNVTEWRHIPPVAFGALRAALITCATATDAERVAWARNIVTAADLVRDELRAAGR